ncbi:MAG: hypothetical protein LEGION0403_FIIPPAGN_01129 [Legionella sp.]|uniref:hypothetical protein n=1 Tax=Legionella sp. TaxID=459 RepID=UPI003D0DB804
MDIDSSQLIRSSLIGIVILLLLLFIPVGTLNYWHGWVYTLVLQLPSASGGHFF